MQEEAPNHRKLRRLSAGVVSVAEKAQSMRQVRTEKANVSEPLTTCRNPWDDVKTEGANHLGINLGGTCVLPRWHPAYRRRELGPGSGVERGNLSPR